jgi:hypothetical protein
MKTCRIALCLLAVVSAFAQSQSKSPTLSETLEWMKSTLGPKGFTESARNGYNKYEAVPGKVSYTETIKSFSYDGCRIKIVKIADTVDPIFGGEYVAQYTDEFDLSDFDSSTVDTESGDGDLKGHLVIFSTTNDQKLIRCSAVTLKGKDAGKPTPCVPATDDTEQLRFSSENYTKRFSKALRHAIDLCGGKRSTFLNVLPRDAGEAAFLKELLADPRARRPAQAHSLWVFKRAGLV